MRFKISCILIALFTIYACNLEVKHDVKLDVEHTSHNGHDYIIFYKYNDMSIVHDPDCKKCYERYD